MSSLEAFKKVEDDYALGLGILRTEFGRLRGSAEAFTNSQAKEILALQEGMQDREVNKDDGKIRMYVPISSM